ncbi:MAG: hypothetical protein IBJ17_10125 [Reyranella sp.]|nr:hypothetical protein [Reyranella sp.]
MQKALVEGEIDPALARWRLARLGIDHALEQRDIDGDDPEAASARDDVRHLLDAFETIEGRPATVADIDAIVVRALGEAADGALVREPSEPFDPQHVVPTQAGRPPTRPPPPGTQPTPLPGPRDNRPRPETPPGLPTPLENFGRGRQSVPPAPAAPLPPNAAGPGAAAAGDDEARRRRALEEARESLKALAPDHQFLKEPPDAVPDQAKVDRHEREVVRIVSEKVDAKVGELRSKSTYEQRSEIRTIGGDVDLRAEFDKLKVTGRRIFSGDGQYGRGGSGEMYELPGGTRVGFRMANDVRTGAKNSVPTLDVAVPGSNQVRFHYNPTR